MGCQVCTTSGEGTVIKVDGDDVTIELEQWEQGTAEAKSKDRVIHTTTHSHGVILSSSFCDIGSCVYTKYGPGVLLKYHRDSEKHVVRLWRPRGQGSATAYMPRDDFVRVIKAMPGMSVKTTYGIGVMSMYLHDKDMYMVQLPYGVAHLNEASVLSCDEAKVLPTAEYLADLTLGSVNLNQLYADFTGNESVKTVMEPISAMIEKFRGGQISSVDEVLSIRSKQLNDHVMELDVNTLNKSLQDKIDSIAGDSGKIEMLLEEGKKRIAALIENADSREELVSTTKTSLQDYLATGKDQLNAVLGRLNASSSTKEQDIAFELEALSQDMNSSLSVIKNLAASDPVLEGLMMKLQNTNEQISVKASLFKSAVHETEAMQVLEAGGKDLQQRLANILDHCSSDVNQVILHYGITYVFGGLHFNGCIIYF